MNDLVENCWADSEIFNFAGGCLNFHCILEKNYLKCAYKGCTFVLVIFFFFPCIVKGMLHKFLFL